MGLKFDLVCFFCFFLLNNPLACSLLAIPRTLSGGQAGVLQHSLLPHQRGLCFYWGTQTSENSVFSFIWQWRPLIYRIKCVQCTEHLLSSLSEYWCCNLNEPIRSKAATLVFFIYFLPFFFFASWCFVMNETLSDSTAKVVVDHIFLSLRHNR